MFVGTASDVGKSVLATAFCRIFLQDGLAPAPFKGQNMSLNSYATPEGHEIGRAQAVQAEAAGINCHTDMNPVLLKPTSDIGSQVILNGRVYGNMSAAAYFSAGNREVLFNEVKKAFHRLHSRYQPIVMEGAGSISELNLKALDITNLSMAIEASAATYLVADIDKGGVFASLYGTISLLSPEEKACIKGLIINKFRGDPLLFASGKKLIEELCEIPVVGIIPFYHDISIEEEDSVSLRKKTSDPVAGKINIAVILLDHISNFTDFDRLEQHSRINLYYTSTATAIAAADIIILPGTKNTIDDLISLRKKKLDVVIRLAVKSGKTVIGICGGFQMMGETLSDPYYVERLNQANILNPVTGIGILPVHTVFNPIKLSRQCSFKFRNQSELAEGYEIHMGETSSSSHNPVNEFTDGSFDGYFLNNQCWGSYIHGILDNDSIIESIIGSILNGLRDQKTNNANQEAEKPVIPKQTYKQFKNEQYDKLAAHIRQHIDIQKIYLDLTN